VDRGKLLLDIEDILAYGYCPLKEKYRLWGGVDKERTLRQAVDRAVAVAIGSYLTFASNGGTPALAHKRSIEIYKQEVARFGRERLIGTGMGFHGAFTHGLILINRFHRSLVPRRDVPVHGFFPAVLDLGDFSVKGDILGTISFNDAEPQERTFCVVQVGRVREKVPTQWSRLRNGFAYAFLKQGADIGFRKAGKLEVMTIDTGAALIERRPMESKDMVIFEALAKVACLGIRSHVFPPQPSVMRCSGCSFELACDLKYSNPGATKWQRREFLRKLREFG